MSTAQTSGVLKLAVQRMVRFAMPVALGAALAQVAHADLTGINFAGDPSLAASQSLTSIDTAGLVPQGMWNNASGISGQMKLEADPQGTIPTYFLNFVAQWTSYQTGSASITAGFGNQKMMKGSIEGAAGIPAVVQVTGIPSVVMSQDGYAVLVYCDSPNNTSDVVIKCSLDSGGTTRTLYLRDPANTSYSGTYVRAPFTSTQDLGSQTPSGNVFIFTGLTATDAAVALEPAASTPGAVVGLTGIQLIPANKLPALLPKISSRLSATATLNVAFSYTIQADLPVTSYDAVGLPAGLTIDRLAGTVTGTPTVAGDYQVTLKASNAAGTATETLVLQVQYAATQPVDLSVFMVPAVLVRGTVGQNYLIESTDAMGNTNNWQLEGTLTLTNQSQFYVDLTATNAVKRFYRARPQQ